jgi:hypothetical protein
MEIPMWIRETSYTFGYLMPKDIIRSYFRKKADDSPSLQTLGAAAISEVADFEIARDVRLRHIFGGWLGLFAIYSGALILIGFYVSSPVFTTIYTVGAILTYAILLGLIWQMYRTTQENLAVTRLFFIIHFLDKNEGKWPSSKFRWQVARRLEKIARNIEQIPLASKSLTSSVKQEAFKLSRSKAQAIRSLELWAIRPMASTREDLLRRLTADLDVIAKNRWYDLPEEEAGLIERPRWLYVLQIIGAILIIGGAISLTAFAAKLGPASSILTLVLLALAIGLLNSAGISTGVIDRYVQTGSKVMSSNKLHHLWRYWLVSDRSSSRTFSLASENTPSEAVTLCGKFPAPIGRTGRADLYSRACVPAPGAIDPGPRTSMDPGTYGGLVCVTAHIESCRYRWLQVANGSRLI